MAIDCSWWSMKLNENRSWSVALDGQGGLVMVHDCQKHGLSFWFMMVNEI